jgi:hypothetical protein
MRILITTCATDNYLYAMDALLQAVAQNVYENNNRREGVEYELHLVGNKSINKYGTYAQEILPDCVEVLSHLDEKWRETAKYQPEQNLMVAQMRTAALHRARKINADFIWFLDADVIPVPNSLACSLDMLAFDGGWYDIAFCPYGSQGGGSFLGGHGSPETPIFPDYNPDEREVPKSLRQKFERLTRAFEKKPTRENRDALRAVGKEIKETCPVKFGGNIDRLNAEYGWRRRGWYDAAYPGTGLGMVLPTAWWGFGCTLLSRKALSHCDFFGYAGRGTEDLFVGYQKFFSRSFRSCVIPHCPAGHVIRKGEKREIVHCHAYHEIIDEETRGHLRRAHLPFYAHSPGEAFRDKPEFQRIHSDETSNTELQEADVTGDDADAED